MTRLVSFLRDALRPGDTHHEPEVHFHAVGGRPEVCHDERCTRPQLAVR